MRPPSLMNGWRLHLAVALAAGCPSLSCADAAMPIAQTEPQLKLDEQARRVEAELRGDILKFWLEHTRDRENGGFYGQIDNNLAIKRDAARGALLTSRILWTFSAAFRRYKDPAYLEMARWAYADLFARFWDQQYGGLYWSVSPKSGPLDDRKIIYVQAFGIYGLAEFHRATGEREPLDRAIELYRLVERHAHDHTNLGYFEEFTRDWKISRDRGPRRSAMGSMGQKSQNVHLHMLEAYTNLLRVWPDQGLRTNLLEIADVLRTRVLDPTTHHLRLFLDEDWTVRSDEISFGHDIEFSWLLVESAEVLGDKALVRQAKAEAVKIADATLSEGVDPDGGVLGAANPSGITKFFKEWWPQAEAAVGFLNAYQITGDKKYLQASLHSWDFITAHLIDRKNGEWFLGVSRDGKTTSPIKVSFWKCPYHNSRACMELIERLHRLNASQ